MPSTYTEMPPGFGALLRHYRASAGLSQEQLADRAGISANAVSALERGVRQVPYRDTVRLLAGALGLAPGEQAALEATIARGRGAAAATAAGDTAAGDTAAPRHAAAYIPTPPNPLIGRKREIAEVGALLRADAPRLLTLIGPGGVGKTRLALQAAAEAEALYPGAVAFVGLAPLRDASLVASAIAHALGVRERGDRTPLESVRAYLRDARLLVVLDNVEHLVEAMPLVSELLAAAPGLRILATSRAALRLQGEQLYPVGPLATPDPHCTLSLDALARVPAVELLLQRARAAIPSFALSDATAASVTALCRQLDGLPLALELAAARLTVLSPQVLSQRLVRRLPVLTGGPRDLPERQRTMRATLAWSYDLLDEQERALFRHLSVLAGGCRLEAAAAIAPERLGTIDDVTDVIGALVGKSLLQRSLDADGEPRFTMLETVREYGLECLEERGEAPATRLRHATYCLAVAEAAAPVLIGAEQSRWLARLEEERYNLRAALHWARQAAGDPREGRAQIGLRIAAALWRFWYRRGYLDEGRRCLEGLLEAAGGEEPATPQALHALAALVWAQGAYEQAAALAGRSLALHQATGDTAGTAAALQLLGVIASDRADYVEAESRAEACLALYRQLGDAWGSATALHNLGAVAHQRGDYARAAALYEACLGLKRTLGDLSGVAVTLNNLGDALAQQDQLERGAQLLEESLALHRELGVREGINGALNALGLIARHAGDGERATSLYEEGLAVARDQGARGHEAIALVNLGDLARDRGEIAPAIDLYQEGLALADEIGQKSAVAYGLEGLAAIAQVCRQPACAARLYGAAEALRERIDAPLSPIERREYARNVAAVGTALGEAIAPLWAEGRAWSTERAVEEALGMSGVSGAVARAALPAWPQG